MKKILHYHNFLLLANGILTLLSLGILYNYFFGRSPVGFFGALQLVTLPILGCHLFFFVLWIFKRSKWAMLSLMILVVSYTSFGDFLKFESSETPSSAGFSVMSYNVKGFNRFEWIKVPNAGDSIATFLRSKVPDILCIQEHNRNRYKELKHYPFKMETPRGVKKSTQAIFSKFPIIDEGSLNLPKSDNNIIFADMIIDQDTVRVYNVHLESFKIIPDSTDISSEESERLYHKITSTITRQRSQALLLNDHILKSPYNVLVCGDFNNTPFSRVYRMLAQDMGDSFQSKGKGFGSTYSLKGIPMRIDYILGDDGFEFLEHHNFKKGFSDHEPIMATLRLKTDK